MLSTIQFGHAHELSTLVGAADAQKSSTGTTTGSGSSTTSRPHSTSAALTRPSLDVLFGHLVQAIKGSTLAKKSTHS